MAHARRYFYDAIISKREENTPITMAEIGMLTDSRSFISYPRHELYRRVLCDYLGELIEKGEYFSGEKYLKQIIEDICFNNVNEFFGFGCTLYTNQEKM